MMDVKRGEAGEVLIRIEGIFDRNAAARLSRWISGVPRATPLVIDFSRVDDLQDVGVATVAQQLVGHSGVALRGLGRHQLRLLRYCGLELPRARGEGEIRDE
jgi:anti-anti-sigma regulatory factor